MHRKRTGLAIALLALLLSTSVTLGATFYVDRSVSQSGDGSSWETAFKTIQEGIGKAHEAETVLVAPGTYQENIHFRGFNITLRSTDPLDPQIVSETIIDGSGSPSSVVTFTFDQNETSLLSGFTIRHGNAPVGGAVHGCGATVTVTNNVFSGNVAGRGGALYRCEGTIESNAIIDNSAEEGGGLYWCWGPIHNNTIARNTATDGGGIWQCNGTIRNNLITANSAERGGGVGQCTGHILENTISDNQATNGAGLYDCDATIEDNIISGNSATESGGGIFGCEGTIQNNRITGNSAATGGGVAECRAPILYNTISDNVAEQNGGGLANCGGRELQGNTITRNAAGGFGGGLYSCFRHVQNNIIAGNSARNGGGLSECSHYLTNNTIVANVARERGGGLENCYETDNSIIWGNTATLEGAQLDAATQACYCCIQNWDRGGEGNISENPLFLDPDGPDDDPDTCEDNVYRLFPNSPCIDTGSNRDVQTDSDFDSNLRIADGGKSLTVDMGVYEHASRRFIITRILPDDAGRFQLSWNSQPGDLYTVWSSEDFSSWQWIRNMLIPSAGATTSCILPLTASRRHFYRIEISPVPFGLQP